MDPSANNSLYKLHHILGDYRLDHYNCFTSKKDGKKVYLMAQGKTGTQFFRNYFKDNKFIRWDPYKFKSNDENIKFIFKTITNKNSIIIIRNPLTRLISCYLEMIKPRPATKIITNNMEYYKLLKNNNIF